MMEHSARALPVDWDELELALTTRDPEQAFYLDVMTGRLELLQRDLEASMAKSGLILVEPLPAYVEHSWMERFADQMADRALGERLLETLRGRGAFKRFKHALLDHPKARERWFAFRERRLHEAAGLWLAQHGLKPATEPP